MADFKKLKVWQKAHALALHTHRVAARIRGSQNVALRNQITRTAQSIPANIVEGRSHTSQAEFRRFLGYSQASAKELEYHLIAARDLELIAGEEFAKLLEQLVEVRKMLHGLCKRIDIALGRPPAPNPLPDPPPNPLKARS